MKYAVFILILTVFGLSVKGQTLTQNWTNNSVGDVITFNSSVMTNCTDTYSGGFTFSADYDIIDGAKTGTLFSIWSLTDNGQVNQRLLSAEFDGTQIVIERLTKYVHCVDWSGGACTTWSTSSQAYTKYSTWDNLFIEEFSGTITITLSNSGLVIKNKSLVMGSEKADLSYDGIHLTGFSEALTLNNDFVLVGQSVSGIKLENIVFQAGEISYTQGLTLVAEGGVESEFQSASPKTNFYQVTTTSPRVAADQPEYLESETEDMVAFSIYPNPVANANILHLEMNLESDSEVYFTILDVEGKKLETFNKQMSSQEQKYTMEIHIDGYKPGLYLYDLQITGKQRKRGKILID